MSNTVQNTRVLIVDDDEMSREVLREEIQLLGYEVDEACCGPEALQTLSTTPYGIVFMDFEMLPLNGLETARRIREKREYYHNPTIIGMTGDSPSSRVYDKAESAGISSILFKPFSLKDLRYILADTPNSSDTQTESDESGVQEDKESTTTQPGNQPDKEWQELYHAGLNIKEGLTRVAHNESLYFSLLESFEERQKHLLTEASKAFCTCDWRALRNIAHSIKGSAGNLGAEQVQQHAEHLQYAAEAENVDECERFLKQLQQEVETVCAAIHVLRTHPDAGQSDTNNSYQNVLQTCRHLDALLKENDVESIAALRQLQQYALPDASLSQIPELKKHVTVFDFEEARKHLKKIIADLETQHQH